MSRRRKYFPDGIFIPTKNVSATSRPSCPPVRALRTATTVASAGDRLGVGLVTWSVVCCGRRRLLHLPEADPAWPIRRGWKRTANCPHWTQHGAACALAGHWYMSRKDARRAGLDSIRTRDAPHLILRGRASSPPPLWRFQHISFFFAYFCALRRLAAALSPPPLPTLSCARTSLGGMALSKRLGELTLLAA